MRIKLHKTPKLKAAQRRELDCKVIRIFEEKKIHAPYILLKYLQSHQEGFQCSVEFIMEKLGIDRSAYDRRLATLKDLGFVHSSGRGLKAILTVYEEPQKLIAEQRESKKKKIDLPEPKKDIPLSQGVVRTNMNHSGFNI